MEPYSEDESEEESDDEMEPEESEKDSDEEEQEVATAKDANEATNCLETFALPNSQSIVSPADQNSSDLDDSMKSDESSDVDQKEETESDDEPEVIIPKDRLEQQWFSEYLFHNCKGLTEEEVL